MILCIENDIGRVFRIKKSESDTTIEFYQNIFNNLYTFCLRGTGNFSARFFETLAMGRIPVLVDTDCRLPFHNEIEWKQHCIMIPEKEVNKLGEKIFNFHNDHSEKELNDIQVNNRMIWETYLMKESYFINLANHLKQSMGI